jgi:osmotically-inducible protein OsmY
MEMSMLKKYLSCCALPFLLSGCGVPIVGGLGTVGMSAVEDRGVSGVASDQAIRVKLNLELSDFEGFEITVYKGRVLFTGVVANAQVKAQIVQIAHTVSGVKQVIDHMVLSGQAGFAEYTRDGWMTTKLKAALYSDEDIIAPNYLITTFDKTIYIFGTAQSQQELDLVMTHAYEITGVKKVVNLMEIKKG